MALIAYLTIYCRMPRRVVEAFLEHVLGISMSLGSTQKCWEQASAAVAQPCQELEQQLKKQPVLNSDETGWRSNGEKRYLWALVAPSFVFYMVAKTRSSEVLMHLLGAVRRGGTRIERGLAATSGFEHSPTRLFLQVGYQQRSRAKTLTGSRLRLADSSGSSSIEKFQEPCEPCARFRPGLPTPGGSQQKPAGARLAEVVRAADSRASNPHLADRLRL